MLNSSCSVRCPSASRPTVLERLFLSPFAHHLPSRNTLETFPPAPYCACGSMHLVTYMRISVTDRCNERCAYCLPHDVAIEWLPRGQILTYEEILRVARIATSIGVSKFRVTGGEPLVRRNVAEFIGELNKLPGVTDIGLSTNATLLAPLARQLRCADV